MDELNSSNTLADVPSEGCFEVRGSQLKELLASLHNCPSDSKDRTRDKFIIKKRSAKSIQINCIDCEIEVDIPIRNDNN